MAKRLPTNLKLIKGTDQPCRINAKEPKPGTDEVRMPPGMSSAAKREWKRMVPKLRKCKVITNIDVRAFALYCESYANWEKATNAIAKTSMVVRGSQGAPMVNPYYRIARQEMENMRRFLVEFGMTPSSRAKVSTAGDDQGEGDGWDRF